MTHLNARIFMPNAQADEPIEPNTQENVEALPSIAELLKQLEDERAAAQDKLLRAYAEVENVRRRAAKDVEDAKAFSISRFAQDMLAVADNMTRALAAIPENDRTEADGLLKSLIEGVEMTEREMARVMERNGVKAIDAMGQKFDPNLHQAVFEVPTDAQEPGFVMQVMQTGYTVNGRVLRPAFVGVSKASG